jgi:hypothetical protein
MIHVVLTRHKGKIRSITISGHAESDVYGRDLVCAAVSGILTGCTNAIQEEAKFHLDVDEGYYKLEAIDSLSPHDEAVIDTIIVGLKTIANEYDKFIQIQNL